MIRTASCHCGAVEIRCTGDPAKVSLCHCLDCQRRTGSLFSVAAFWDRERVALDRTGVTEFWRESASGYPVAFFHCATCGSNVWWEPARMPNWVGVAVGAFADPGFARPEQAVWAKDQHRWLATIGSLPAYPENPPSRVRTPLAEGKGELAIIPFENRHFADIRDLWLKAFPGDPPRNRAEHAIAEKLRMQPDLFLVAERAGRVIGSAMAGYDGHRGWLYSIAVDPELRGESVGSALLAEAERRLASLGCRKVNLQVREGNEGVIRFYERHGYKIEFRSSMGKCLAG